LKGKNSNVAAGRRRVRGSILVRLVIFTMATALILLGYYRFFPGTISNFLTNYMTIEAIEALRGLRLAAAVILYMFGCILICVHSSTGYLKNLDLIADSVLELPNEAAEIPTFPSELSDVEIALRDVRFNIARSKKAAEESEKQKRELLTFLAHDLRTPLTSVIGYISLLQENPDMPEEKRVKYIDIAKDKAERLEELLNEFFDITRMNLQTMELTRQEVDVTTMLYQLSDEFYPALTEKGLGLRMEVAGGLRCQADSDKLARVFDNLLRNAAAYAYRDTEVRIAADEQEGRIRILVENRGDHLPPEKLELLFNKFYRGDSSRSSSTGGAGLGLAIAREIVELHGGTIVAESEDNMVRFVVSLPK